MALGTALEIYRRFLWLYPAEFRAVYAHELCLFFVDRWREEPSPAGRFRLWLTAAAGVLHEAPKEHKDMILQDLRYAFRLLRKDRSVTIAAVAILALGIGSTTLVFSLANGLLVRPLPYRNLDRLVAVAEQNPTDASQSELLNFLNYLDLRARAKLLTDIGLYTSGVTTIRGEGAAEDVHSAVVTDGVFNILGVAPLMGRTFTRAESMFKGPPVAILSAELWHKRYAGDPKILGRLLEVGKLRCVVIGVMPADFHFPDRAEVWKPMQYDPAEMSRTDYSFNGIAQLRPGVGVEQASAELAGLLKAIHGENPAANNGYSIRALPFREFVAGSYRQAVLILLIAVSLLLLIACANVSNLLLVKASARSREMAVRTAIGASRSRVVRQLLVEGLLLGVAGGLAGLLLARLGEPALMALIPEDMPRWMDFSIDYRVLGFALLLSLGTSLGFGLAPAFSTYDRNVTESLKDGRSGGTRRRMRLMQRGLVIGEVALSFTLLAAAGLMIHSFVALRGQPLGYHPERAMAVSLGIPTDRYPGGPRFRQLITRLRSEIGALPGVESVAFSSGVPLDDDWSRIFTIEGHPVALEKMPNVNHIVITPEYFKVLGIQMLRGRNFTESDWDQALVVVTRSFAAKYWPHADPVGKRVRFGPPAANEPWHTVVGVVADSRHGDLRDHERTNIYLPYGVRFATPEMVVRAATDPIRFAPTVQRRIVAVDRDIAVSAIQSLDQYLDIASWRDRFIAVLFAAFAVLALVLASGGLYASLAYSVELQTHDIGVRMALGASAARVRRFVLRQGMTLVVLGLGLGIATAAALTGLVRSQLYGISPFDPLTYAVAPGVLLAAALIATMVPSRRATRVDPVDALRKD